jgi:hypothetical protein
LKGAPPGGPPAAFHRATPLANWKDFVRDIAARRGFARGCALGQNQHPSEDGPRRFVSSRRGEGRPTRVSPRPTAAGSESPKGALSCASWASPSPRRRPDRRCSGVEGRRGVRSRSSYFRAARRSPAQLKERPCRSRVALGFRVVHQLCKGGRVLFGGRALIGTGRFSAERELFRSRSTYDCASPENAPPLANIA